MIIQSNNTIYKYTSSQVLDLMNPPSPDANRQLYNDYYNFINGIDAIYGTQTSHGNIPVFRTKEDDLSDNLSADPDSTLRYLVPNESYLFIVNSDSHLPLKIPNPIGLTDFAVKLSREATTQINCCPLVDVETSVTLNQSAGYMHVIRADIDQMISNEKYFYQIKPVFSNWPAKISPQSGEIVIPDKPDIDGKVSGHIESVFSYYEYLTDNLDESIPYVINKSTTNPYYNKNIFSIVNLSVYNEKCIVYDKNIVIRCKSCVKNSFCPDVSISSAGSGKTRYITASLTNLQHNTSYRYEFSTDSSNLPASISPISGILSKGVDQNSLVLYSVFKYCNIDDNNCNLDSTIPDSYADPAISAGIYTNLILSIYPIENEYCDVVSNNILIECNKCFDENNFRTSVSFLPPEYRNNFTAPNYPALGDGYPGIDLNRPNTEYNLYTSGLNLPCCDKPAILQLEIKNAIAGDKYTYDFTSYPQITIVPNTGIVSFGNSSGVISVLGYIEDQRSSSVHVVLTHEKSNQKASDATIIRCPEPW